MPAYGKNPYKRQTTKRRKKLGKAPAISVLDSSGPFLKTYKLRMKRAFVVCGVLFVAALFIALDGANTNPVAPLLQQLTHKAANSVQTVMAPLSAATPTQTPTQTPAATTAQPVGFKKFDTTIHGKLWFYDSPSAAAKTAGFLEDGDTVEVVNQTDSWYALDLGYRQVWVKMVDLQQQSTPHH